jgi:hypothetical protein
MLLIFLFALAFFVNALVVINEELLLAILVLFFLVLFLELFSNLISTASISKQVAIIKALAKQKALYQMYYREAAANINLIIDFQNEFAAVCILFVDDLPEFLFNSRYDLILSSIENKIDAQLSAINSLQEQIKHKEFILELRALTDDTDSDNYSFESPEIDENSGVDAEQLKEARKKFLLEDVYGYEEDEEDLDECEYVEDAEQQDKATCKAEEAMNDEENKEEAENVMPEDSNNAKNNG